jgi:hypothetical protein
MMVMISFSTNKTEHALIERIADRATAIARQNDIEYPTPEAAMDITATHANGCPLRLKELLAAEPFNFAHDVFGIRRHLNRETGALENCFVPRYAAR